MRWSSLSRDDCGGICQAIRQAVFTAVLWVPLICIAWWAWGWRLAYSPWLAYESADMLTPVVKPGAAVQVKWAYTVHRDCPRHIEMRLAQGDVELLLYAHRGRTTGQGPGHREFVSEVLLPVLPAGEYALLSTSTGMCTPLYSETIRARPVRFTVTEGE